LKSPSELPIVPKTGAATRALVYEGARHRDSDQGSDTAGTLILAHGAGAGQRSTFMVDFADALSDLGLDVVTFDFPYIEHRRRIPDRAPVLEACYRDVIGAVVAGVESAGRLLCIGGKSMGGRIASQVAAADASLPVAGLVLLGYPLHPPGRPLDRRDKHLPAVARPMLFVQGARDAFGTPDELTPIVQALQPPPTLHRVPQGDHSFKLSSRNPAAQAALYAAIQRAIVVWIRALAP
jgi:uncharacterized protein